MLYLESWRREQPRGQRMEANLLNAASGDAIARDWELPELPSGMQGSNIKQLDITVRILIRAHLVISSFMMT